MKETNLDLSQLSLAEELWLWRIRQPVKQRPNSTYHRDALTRGEAAKVLGMSLERYKNLEAGRRINIALDELPKLAFLRSQRNAISLKEQMILARRRSGLYIREISKQFGLSHTRMLAHEDMASQRLIDFWSERGYFGWHQPKRTPRPLFIKRSARQPVAGAHHQSAAVQAPVKEDFIEQAAPRMVEPTPVARPRPALVRRGVVIETPAPPPTPVRPTLLRRNHAA
jgi:hypothetical protein